MKAIDAIARTILYEGLRLYPYRESALKNQRCFLIGTIPPGGDVHTECLFTGKGPITVTVRFIDIPNTKELSFTLPALACDEAIEHPIEEPPFRGRVIAKTSRDSLAITLENHSLGDDDGPSFGAAHLVLAAPHARFTALTDLPAHVQQAQRGLWPILIDDHHILASPIILSDRPTIAPESMGDLMDATEIEEILSLRIQTLTEDEKAEARTSAITRSLVDRTLALDANEMDRLHGTFRNEDGFVIGERVVLWPHERRRADAVDLLLRGMAATIVGIETTDLGEKMFSVTIDLDPGRDLGELGFPGHRFFFRADEMEKRS